jgi:creatinine amidohydrolase/Fe(II)-dependent formamide hydrolase-like protein
MTEDQNGCGTDCPSHLLSRLTFVEIEREIARFPAVVLPLGGTEPYGSEGALGIASSCSEAIAAELSRRHAMLQAPVLHYGCSTPYTAFGGAAGVKPRTFTNTLCEILRRFRRKGIELVVIIDSLFDNGPAIDEAVGRLKKWDRNLHVVTFGLQREERLRAFIARRSTVGEPGRSVAAMLSLAAYIDPGLVRGSGAGIEKVPSVKPERYTKWRRRGADPEQFRALFPDGTVTDGGSRYDADAGGELFEYSLALLEETVAPFLPLPGRERIAREFKPE